MSDNDTDLLIQKGMAELLRFKKNERQKKVDRAFKAAHARLIKILEDPDKRKELNRQFNESLKQQTKDNDLSLPENYFDISEQDVEHFKAAVFELSVAKDVEANSKIEPVTSCTILLKTNSSDKHIVTNPNFADNHSQDNLEKIFLHEFGHALHQARDYDFQSKIRPHSFAHIAYNYIKEFNADIVSDFVKVSPTMAELHKEFAIHDAGIYLKKNQNNYQFTLNGEQYSYTEESREKISDFLIQEDNSSHTHPSYKARIENSNNATSKFASKRYEDYLSNLYGINVPSEFSFIEPVQAQPEVLFEQILDAKPEFNQKDFAQPSYSINLVDKGMKLLSDAGKGLVNGVKSINNSFDRAAKSFHPDIAIQNRFKENKAMFVGGMVASAGIVAVATLSGGTLPVMAFLASSAVSIYGGYRQDMLRKSINAQNTKL